MRVTYLSPGAQPVLDTELWILVERDASGQFFGTGSGKKPSGEAVFYASAVEHDVSLDAAVRAACDWAERHGVGEVQVQQHCAGMGR